MTQGWLPKKVGDVCTLEYGKPLPANKRDPAGKIPAYGANGVKCRTNEVFWDKPSIIIGRKGSAGEVTLPEDRFWPLDVTYYVDFDAAECDRMFLYHFFVLQDLPRLARGVKPGINRNDVYKIPIDLPPLPEQKRIVAILDEAFAGIDQAVKNTQRNLASARELFESELNRVFLEGGEGWEEKRLEDVCNLQTGATPKASNTGSYGDAIPFITPGDFRTDGSLTYDNRGLSAAGLANARVVPAGSALMVCIGATIGKAGFSNREVVTNQQINAATPRVSLLGKYVYYQFLTKRFQEAVLASAGQATLPIISKNKFGALPFWITRLDKQEAITDLLDRLGEQSQSLAFVAKQKLSVLRDLRQSILQKAFAGELTMGDADRELAEAGA